MQGEWTKWLLKVPPNPNYSLILKGVVEAMKIPGPSIQVVKPNYSFVWESVSFGKMVKCPLFICGDCSHFEDALKNKHPKDTRGELWP